MDTDDNPLNLLVRNLETHSRIGADDRRAILDLPCKLRALELAGYIVREGDPPQHCALIVSGLAFRQKNTGGGTRQIVALHVPGETVGFQNLLLDVSDHSTQMLTRGEVAEIPRAAMQELVAARPSITRAVMVSTLIEASIFREWILNIGRRDARTRLAHLLCEFAVRLEAVGLPHNGYELPMTQEQLADATGLTSVHVNRVLKSLESEGLITRNRRNISFPDWKRLRDVGDFNPRYLHLDLKESGET